MKFIVLISNFRFCRLQFSISSLRSAQHRHKGYMGVALSHIFAFSGLTESSKFANDSFIDIHEKILH